MKKENFHCLSLYVKHMVGFLTWNISFKCHVKYVFVDLFGETGNKIELTGILVDPVVDLIVSLQKIHCSPKLLLLSTWAYLETECLKA